MLFITPICSILAQKNYQKLSLGGGTLHCKFTKLTELIRILVIFSVKWSDPLDLTFGDFCGLEWNSMPGFP